MQRPRNTPEIDYDKYDDNEGARLAWNHHRTLNDSIIVDLFHVSSLKKKNLILSNNFNNNIFFRVNLSQQLLV